MKKILLFLTIAFFASISCNNDPCVGVLCTNGGSCVNGTCDCPKQWTGTDCSKQKIPSKIFITKIDVIKFPATKTNGAGWDTTSGADIFPIFYEGTNISTGATKLWESETFYTDAKPALVYTFTPKTAITITKPLEKHVISLYDNDAPVANEYIGGINFIPYSDTNGFPTTRVVDCDGTCSTAYKLYLEYEWQ